MKTLSLILVVCCGLGAVAGRAAPQPFLFLKTGEKFATQSAAGPTVTELTAFLGEQVMGDKQALAPQVMNDPRQAVEFCAAQKPVLGIVTPGFLLTYEKALGMEPLLETKREKVPTEAYVLVVPKVSPDDLSALAGKRVITPLAAEERYLLAVVLQGKLGGEVRLEPTMDVEGAVFALAEDDPKAGDAVLLEEAAWSLFEGDEELASKLKVLYRSDPLPSNLVVIFKPNAGDLDAGKVADALKGMRGTDAARAILHSIRVESFVPFDREQLDRARKLFLGQ